MRTEYQRLTYSSQLEASIKFQRRVLMAATTGAEFCNKRFNPFDVELDGWSENVMENIDEYDNVFEELFIKYRESVQVAPEIRLLMTLGGSAMMFHFTKPCLKQPCRPCRTWSNKTPTSSKIWSTQWPIQHNGPKEETSDVHLPHQMIQEPEEK